MTDTKLNLSALKKDSITQNIENEVTDLILEPEEIGLPNDTLEKNTILEGGNIIETLKNESARDEITLDIGHEEFKTDTITENDFISSPTSIEDIDQENNNKSTKEAEKLAEANTIELSQEKEEPIIVLEDDDGISNIETKKSEEGNKGEEKETFRKKKKTMLSLSSIKSIPKTEAKKIEEEKQALAKKAEDEKVQDNSGEKTKETSDTKIDSGENITPIDDSEIGEEIELIPEDKQIVEEATKNIQEDIKAADETVEDDKVQITLDKSLFDNYIPNYKGKKESKAEKKEKKNEKGAKNVKKTKRIRGPINKKKRNLLIVAMFLCILGAGGFVLYPHLHDSADIKSDVIQVTQDAVREKVDLVLDTESQEEIVDENTGDSIETDEGKESETNEEIAEIDTETKKENSEIEDEEKDDKAKVKNYLLDNYYN